MVQILFSPPPRKKKEKKKKKKKAKHNITHLKHNNINSVQMDQSVK